MVVKKMPKNHTFSWLLISGGVLLSAQAGAAVHRDARGNTGYDTAAECDAAVQNGTAKFYVPITKNKPVRQKGEKSIQSGRISDLGAQYSLGACDMGVGKKQGQQGVDRKLQGKYVPFSPSMPLNTYLDASGQVVRVSMHSCNNRFSASIPRAVSIPAPPPVTIAPPPPVVAPPPVAVVPPPAPFMPAPVPVVAPPVAGIKPYLFGTIGAQNDAICHVDGDRATLLAGQVGAGVNFNALLGAEVYAQAAKSHTYTSPTNAGTSSTSAVGARLTIGTDLNKQARVFGKLGAAYVNHKFGDDSKSEARPVVGIGFTYDLTPALSLRGDADVSFKRSNNQPHPAWGNDKYLGLGVQYKF